MPAAGLWCKVMATLPRSLKTKKLAEELGIPIAEAVGRLVMMWVYCVEFSPSGLLTYDDLSSSFCADSDIAPDMAAAALTECGGMRSGFLDLIDDGTLIGGGPCYEVHDWADYSGAFNPTYYKTRESKIDKKEKTGTPAAHAAGVENALRAARKRKSAEAVEDAPPLLNGRGRNFKNLARLFADLPALNDESPANS